MPALKARLPRVISIRKNTSALARHKQQSRQADANRRLLPSPIRCFGAALSGVVEPECKLNAPIRPREHNSPAASRSRIYVSSCDCCTGSSQPVAMGRGPYTSTHGTKRKSSGPICCGAANLQFDVVGCRSRALGKAHETAEFIGGTAAKIPAVVP